MEQIECDVLIIGGGLAGCWAAIKAKEKAQRVLLVEKGKVSRSGKSSVAGAGILCPYPSDNLDAWQEEIVVRGQYLADQNWVRILLEEQPARIKDMRGWGVDYERDDRGHLHRIAALGSTVTKVVTVSSEAMMEVLKRRMEKIGVDILERVNVTGLLTSDGEYPTGGSVVGAYGFHTRTGEPYTINAAATVIAAGGVGLYYFTGDGIAMAYRAGAEVWGMEFTRMMDLMTFHRKFHGIHLITFQRLGMRLYNALGERFMERYHPEQKENATRQQMALAVIVEQMEGRGPVYADLTHLDEESLAKLRASPGTAASVRAIEREGLNFGRDRIRFDAHSGFVNAESGGIKHSLSGETSLCGLYAAGEAGGFPANGTGTIPLKLASCCVEGYRAGESAARYAAAVSRRAVSKNQLQFLEAETFGPSRRGKGILPEELMGKVYEYLRPALVSIFRSKRSMQALVSEQETWMHETSAFRANDWHGLVKAHQKKNYIECIGLVARSSLERQETRGMNLRIDYPYRDDAGWMRHVVLRRETGGPRIYYLPVPIDKYPVRPEKYDKIPAKIPWPEYALEETKR